MLFALSFWVSISEDQLFSVSEKIKPTKQKAKKKKHPWPINNDVRFYGSSAIFFLSFLCLLSVYLHVDTKSEIRIEVSISRKKWPQSVTWVRSCASRGCLFSCQVTDKPQKQQHITLSIREEHFFLQFFLVIFHFISFVFRKKSSKISNDDVMPSGRRELMNECGVPFPISHFLWPPP